MHKCAVNDCPARIPKTRLMCPEHWAKVSRLTQRRVWETYRILRPYMENLHHGTPEEALAVMKDYKEAVEQATQEAAAWTM